MEGGLKYHWDRVYNTIEVNNLGWYEESPEPSLDLIELCKLDPSASLLQVGAGATMLVDVLLEMGYKNIIANDLSDEGLDKIKVRLGPERASRIEWVQDDLLRARALLKLDPVDLWHDRAVLHFFTEPKDREVYFDLLSRTVKKSGFVIIAGFNLNGEPKCSGLPVYRTNGEMLKEELGADYILLKAFNYIFNTPSGDTRDYIYTLFQRQA